MRYLKIVSILWLFVVLPLQAAETEGLYEAVVAVSDQGNSARAAGMREAMSVVLLKVCGISRVTEDPELAEVMSSPARYVQQYRYSNERASDGRLQLQVSFDQKGIDSLLRSHGYSIWGDARPTTLIWLGVEDKGTRVLVGANDGGLIRQLMVNEAQRRALPVKLPLLDSTDQGRVRTADVWGNFVDNIKDASQRYNAQAILIGKLYPLSGGSWEARWTLDYRGEVSHWQSQSVEVRQLITEVIDRVANQLAKSFAQSFVSGSSEVMLRVDGIHNLEQYRRVLDYLRGVHGVKQAVAKSLNADSVRFHLMTSGGSDAVLRVIALGNTLERVKDSSVYTPVLGQRMPTQDLPPGAAYPQTSGGQGVDGSPSSALTATPANIEPQLPELVFRLLP